MRSRRFVPLCLITMAMLLTPTLGRAQNPDPQALQQEIERLRSQLAALQQQYDARLAALEARLGSGPAATVAQVEPPAEPLPVTPDTGVGSGKVFNPDMSVISNFAGAAGKNALSDQPSLSLSEVEAAFQAVVDPYARADIFLSISPEGVDVEEGYATFTSLPAGLLLKAGKMRAQFGKVNTMHTHILPWADRPLVSQSLVGGKEGISLPGVSLSRLIQNSALFQIGRAHV